MSGVLKKNKNTKIIIVINFFVEIVRRLPYDYAAHPKYRSKPYCLNVKFLQYRLRPTVPWYNLSRLHTRTDVVVVERVRRSIIFVCLHVNNTPSYIYWTIDRFLAPCTVHRIHHSNKSRLYWITILLKSRRYTHFLG